MSHTEAFWAQQTKVFDVPIAVDELLQMVTKAEVLVPLECNKALEQLQRAGTDFATHLKNRAKVRFKAIVCRANAIADILQEQLRQDTKRLLQEDDDFLKEVLMPQLKHEPVPRKAAAIMSTFWTRHLRELSECFVQEQRKADLWYDLTDPGSARHRQFVDFANAHADALAQVLAWLVDPAVHATTQQVPHEVDEELTARLEHERNSHLLDYRNGKVVQP